jgi:hypothetical protein
VPYAASKYFPILYFGFASWVATPPLEHYYGRGCLRRRRAHTTIDQQGERCKVT